MCGAEELAERLARADVLRLDSAARAGATQRRGGGGGGVRTGIYTTRGSDDEDSDFGE